VVLNAGRAPAQVTLDTAALGGAVRAVDALDGGTPQSWSGTVKLDVPASTGRVYRITR
jgi:hypothetical protein